MCIALPFILLPATLSLWQHIIKWLSWGCASTIIKTEDYNLRRWKRSSWGPFGTLDTAVALVCCFVPAVTVFQSLCQTKKQKKTKKKCSWGLKLVLKLQAMLPSPGWITMRVYSSDGLPKTGFDFITTDQQAQQKKTWQKLVLKTVLKTSDSRYSLLKVTATLSYFSGIHYCHSTGY